MPKQLWKIDQFHGGLNSNSDPRDIADNELSEATDVMVDELGKIRMMGGTAAHDAGSSSTIVIEPGYGLFQFSHDRIGGSVGYLQHLNEAGDPSSSHWNVTGGGDFGGDDTVLRHTHATDPDSTFAQVTGKRAVKGANSCNYKFTYTVAHTSGDEDDITDFKILGAASGSQFASANTDLTQTVGTHETTFTSASDAYSQPFTISITTDDTAVITIDNMALRVFNAQETGDDYLALAAANGTANLTIYSAANDLWTGWAGPIDLGSTTGMKTAFYAVDGSLRVSDGNFGAANETMWYGYIYRRFFGDGSTGYDGTGHTNGILKDRWWSDEAAPKALPIQKIFGALINDEALSDSYPVQLFFDAVQNTDSYTNSNTDEANANDHAIRARVAWADKTITEHGSSSGGAYDNFCSSGDRIFVDDAADVAADKIYTVDSVSDTVITVVESTGSTNSSDYIWIYNLSKSNWYGGAGRDGWEFAVSTLYDDSKQESALSIFELTGTQSGTSDTIMTDTGTKSNGSASFGVDNLIGFVCKNLTDGSQGEITDNDANTITVDDLTGGSDDSWDAGDLYSISIMRPQAPIRLRGGSHNFKEMQIQARVFGGDGINDGLSVINPRVSGFNIYIRWENTETWYLQAEIDISKGIRTSGAGVYKMWDTVPYSSTEEVVADTEAIPSLRQIERYETSSGNSADYTSVGFDGVGTGFKTAVVANRMVYVGNVKIKDKYGDDATIHGDAILKSHVNKFDSFTLDRRLEASVNDGDNIIKLEAYADRLLIFKKKKLELLNISQEVEFLEDTFMHKGVSHPAATCKTDFGIAWVNKQGCYLYDGKKLHNLLEKQGRQIIKESKWATFTNDPVTKEPMIGYIPKKRQLVVVDDITTNGDGSSFLYDMVTQSWIEGAAATFDDQNKTNFVADWNNDLLYAHTAGAVVKWDDAGDDSTAFVLETKDIDFGQPGQKKKVYKVYITYTGVSSLSVNVDYQINGDNGWTGFTSGEPLTASSAQNEATLTLSPSVECYSFQLKFSGTGKTAFEINDISIVFRLKGQR